MIQDESINKSEANGEDRAAIETLKIRNQQLQEEVQRVKAENRLLEELSRQLRENVQRAAAADKTQKERYNQLLEEKQWTSDELKRTQDQLLLAWNSKSWKLTAPLRFMKRITEEKRNPLAEGIRKVNGRMDDQEGEIIPKEKNRWMPSYRKRYERNENILLHQSVKRIAIMYFYDADGIVDETAMQLARGIREVVDRLVVVVGGQITEESRRLLQENYDQVWFRENEGYDFWGYREGLMKEGWKQLVDYDEVLLCNFTVLGPVYPLQRLMKQMEQEDCDFWGITSHPGMEEDPFHCNPYGYIPEHVQSYFLVFRRNMVSHRIFQKFWEKLPPLRTYDQAVGLAETVLTPYFEEAGFHWRTGVDHKKYYPLTDNPLMTMPTELIRDYGCPFFKKRVFFQDYDYYITYTCGQTTAQLMKYLQEARLYDMDMLWRFLLRSCHLSDLNEKLHLTRILPEGEVEGAAAPLKTAAVIHVYDVSMLREIISFCQSLPPETDLFISTTSSERKEIIERAFSSVKNRKEVIVGENRGRDVSGLLVLFREKVKNYDLICVTHDKQTSHLKPLMVGKGFADAGYMNILGSSGYVRRIIRCFEREKRLGLLMAPMPYHADFASQLGNEWGQNFEGVSRLAKDLGLHCPMDQDHPPFAPYGSNFWFRVDAMRPLLERSWTYEDFPKEPLKALDGTIMHAVERIYPFCAQSEGYYSAIVMTDTYASLDLSTLYTYADGWAAMMAEEGVVGKFVDVRNVMRMRLSNS